MASITITQLNPFDYGYSSSFTAIGYTLTEYESIRNTYIIRVLMGKYDTSYTYVNPYDIIFTDSQSAYNGVYIFALEPNTKYQTYFDVEDKNYSEGEMVYANSNKLVFTTSQLIGLDESKLGQNGDLDVTDNILKLPLKYPDGYSLSDDNDISVVISFKITVNNSTENNMIINPFGYIDSDKNYCIPIANRIVEFYENNGFLFDGESTIKTSILIKTKAIGSKEYFVILNITSEFINKLPTCPSFKIKSNDKMYSLFGRDGIAPYGYGSKFLSLYFNSESTVQDSDTISYYKFSKDGKNWYILDISEISNPKINGKSVFDSVVTTNYLTSIYLQPFTQNGYKNVKTISSNKFQLIDYKDPIVTNFKSERLNGFESETTISFNVFISNLTYNGNQYNSINDSVKYGYAKSGNALNPNISVSPSQETVYDNGTEYSYSIILDLANDSSFDFVISVEDQVTSVSFVKSISQGVPLFCQSESGHVAVGRIPNFDSEYKFQTSTDILVNDNGNDVPVLNKLKRHFVCQADEPTDQLTGGLWIGNNEATSKLFKVHESGLTSEYCNAVVTKTSDGEYIDQNEIPANYKTNRWRGICYRYQVEDTTAEDPMGTVYYNEYRIGNLTSESYTPTSGISRHGFMVMCRSDEKMVGFCKDEYNLDLNGQYVLSFYARTSSSTVNAYACFDEFIEYPYDSLTASSGYNKVTNIWKKYQINLTYTDVNKNSLYIYFGGNSTDTYVYFCGAKLDKKIIY